MNMVRTIETKVAIIDPYEQIESEYVESIREYNPYGDLVSEVIYNEKGTILSKRMFELAPDGRILVQMNYDFHTDMIERTEFFDDDDEVHHKTEVTGKDGTKTVHEYQYNQLGNTDRIVIKNENGHVEGYEVFLFNDQNQVIEEIKLNSEHQLEFKKALTYFPDGNLKTETYFDEHRATRTINYTYNENQLVSEKIEVNHDTGVRYRNQYAYDPEGKQILDETFHNDQIVFKNFCTYDDDGNLIEERVMNLGAENYIELRRHTITYRS